MGFNLADILNKILNESVSSDKVNDAINNKYQVIITYKDEDSNAVGKRLIEPYVYGASSAGNPVFRAYQYEGDTFRGKPKWKLFRLDRVESWQPTNNHFNQQPNNRHWNAEDYNTNGDRSMTVVYNQVKFDDEFDDGIFRTDFEKQLLKRKKQRQQSTPINVQDIVPQQSGPVQTVPQTYDSKDKGTRGPIQNKETTPQGYENGSDNNSGPIQSSDIDQQGYEDIENTNRGPIDISDKDWEHDSSSKEELRNKNINQRRDRRADKRTDSQPTWRKGALNQYIQ